MSQRVMNFGAGPAALPLAVLEQVREEWLDFSGTGKSITETSHRSPEYSAVHEETKDRLKQLLRLGDDYTVLFCAGGATTQFTMLPQNLLGSGKFADYIVTGSWSKKAVKEGKIAGEIRVAASSEDRNFTYIPKESAWKLSKGATYLHITSNNTIAGTQWHKFPSVDVPLVADMSSDILWRDQDLSRFGLIYAGAQKNLGPAGVAIVVIRQDFLDQCRTDIASMHSYRVQAEKGSLFNTPPCFAIYMVNKVLAWIEAEGGLPSIEQRNRAKAKVIYDTIDQNADFFRSPVEREDRSQMNIVFRLPSEDLEAQFLSEAKSAGMIGLKGHRTVGGLRASIYNAAPREWCESLANFMKTFAKKNG